MNDLFEININNASYEDARQKVLQLMNHERMMIDSHPETIFAGMHAESGPLTAEEVVRVQNYLLGPSPFGFKSIKSISIVRGTTFEDAWGKSLYPSGQLAVQLISDVVKNRFAEIESALLELNNQINLADSVSSASIEIS